MNYQNVLLIVLILLILFLALNYNRLKESLTDVGGMGKIVSRTSFEDLLNGSVESVGIDELSRMEAMLAVSIILKQINQRTKLIYVLNRIDQIKMDVLPCGSKHYVLDIFVHETRYKITRRLLFDFVIRRDKTITIMSMNISNAFKYADSADGVNPSDPIPELILKDWNMKSEYHIEGNSEGSIPYSLFTGAISKEQPMPDKFRNWILPMGIQITDDAIFPCRRQGKWWDSNGVPITERAGCHCKGLKNTPMRILRYPAENPTVNMGLTEVGENSWLFDKSRGIPDFPTSHR